MKPRDNFLRSDRCRQKLRPAPKITTESRPPVVVSYKRRATPPAVSADESELEDEPDLKSGYPVEIMGVRRGDF